MAKVHVELGDEQRRLLAKHWRFYRALDCGAREPTTAAQRRFVAVCHRVCEPETEHEFAYLRGRELVENSTLSWSDAARRGFQLSSREMRSFELAPPKSATHRGEDHAVDVDRFSSKRRWVPRHNW